MTNMTSDTKAVLLLCSHFGKKSPISPLTPTEYRKAAQELWQHQKRPADLFNEPELFKLISNGTGIDSERLHALMARRVEMGIALEEWTRHGIWVISKSDPDYPNSFRTHLKNNNPPLLYGIGDRKLMKCSGLGFVGSRHVDNEGISFAQEIAKICVANSRIVISGGAKGVDAVSIEAALKANGFAVAILSDNLLKNSLLPIYREAIASGHLLLLSPYYPQAPFSVGNAMGRNKLIYSLADYTLVVSSDYNKGGTWAGAKEELRRPDRKKVYVRISPTVPEGNKKLLELGAIAWPEMDNVNSNSLWDLLEKNEYKPRSSNLCTEGDLFSTPIDISKENDIKKDSEVISSQQEKEKHIIFQTVLPVLLSYMKEPISIDELATTLCVTKSQMTAWIKEAENQNLVLKLNRPTKYQAIDSVNNLK